jgi:DNA-binding MarR family transcriptional regulator
VNEEISIPGPCVNFKVAVLARFMDERYKKANVGLKLTNEQIRLLLNLKMAGTVNQQTLSNRLELEKSTFSRTLKTMITKGYIRKEKTSADARHILLTLSERGLKKVEKIYPAWKKIHEETQQLLGQASIAEIDRILRILKTKR